MFIKDKSPLGQLFQKLEYGPKPGVGNQQSVIRDDQNRVLAVVYQGEANDREIKAWGKVGEKDYLFTLKQELPLKPPEADITAVLSAIPAILKQAGQFPDLPKGSSSEPTIEDYFANQNSWQIAKIEESTLDPKTNLPVASRDVTFEREARGAGMEFVTTLLEASQQQPPHWTVLSDADPTKPQPVPCQDLNHLDQKGIEQQLDEEDQFYRLREKMNPIPFDAGTEVAATQQSDTKTN